MDASVIMAINKEGTYVPPANQRPRNRQTARNSYNLKGPLYDCSVHQHKEEAFVVSINPWRKPWRKMEQPYVYSPCPV